MAEKKDIKKTTKKNIKNTSKKKQGQRGKAKPIISIKNKSLKEKENIVKDLQKDLPKTEDSNMGAPTKMTENTLQTLKLCFSVGMTDEQACYFSKVGTSTLYNYQKEHPDFVEEKKILKESITMQARVNVGRSIKVGNVQESKWWLERKDKGFIDKIQVGGEVKVELTEEQKKKEESLLKKLKNFAIG